MKTNKKQNQKIEKEFEDELFITSRRTESEARREQTQKLEKETPEPSQLSKEKEETETKQNIDDEREFKKSLLGGIDEKKYMYLLLTAPLKEGKVARTYCTRCGEVIDMPLIVYNKLIEPAGIPEFKDPQNFYPKFYFSFKGCYYCSDEKNPPESYSIQMVKGKSDSAKPS